MDGEKSIMGMKFDNHISLGHIITTLGVIFAGLTWGMNTNNQISNLQKQDLALESRLIQTSDQLKEKDVELRTALAQSKADYREDIKDIRQLLKDISEKIDKKADRV